MKQLLCLSNEPWSAAPGRTQQLLSRLEDVDILYFFPADASSPLGTPRQGRMRSGAAVYSLPQPLPAEEGGLIFEIARRRNVNFINARAESRRFHKPLLWVASPAYVHVLDYVEYSGLVYDCDRNWNELPPVWESSLTAAADVVFAASPSLADRLMGYSSNVAALLNGVNYPLFSSEENMEYDPLPGIRGPIFGWAGTIRPSVDFTPLFYAARAHPDWKFVLLGPIEGNRLLSRLDAMSNVLLAGPRRLSEVPPWLYRCDCLMEFLRYDRTVDVISPRMFEYLATAKPVVSMMMPDQVEFFPDVVYAAHTNEEFITMLEHALEEVPGFVSQRRRAYGKSASWTTRAAQVARILSDTGLLRVQAP